MTAIKPPSTTILVVDDDIDTIEMMELIIKKYNYNPVVERTAAVLKNLFVIDPCIIILDDYLMEGRGSEFCKKLKTDPMTAHYKVILMSASNKIVSLSEECAADGFLAKPFDISVLKDLLDKMC